MVVGGRHHRTCLQNHSFRLTTDRQTDTLNTVPAFAVGNEADIR